ncbi:leucine-rich repeat-containing protein 71 isoform X3 [Aquila chrysaetos chrysaetos]|uniref:leucine-rich repeat-containing protein 71 isoform X3 n=1 Tax=Aquila chrysaetos chrysaetos TaxID=223781 RepID=UPI001B7D305D|nr:leucine-rich repeat-containing protein 71 isoform X3 [Aquila chrysaetos chrysaetos]
MRRRGERVPREKAAAVAAEEEMKSTERKAEQGTGETLALAGGGGGCGGPPYVPPLLPALPAEEYQCTGLLEQDFPELCARAGIASVPKVTLRPSPSFPADEEPAELPLAEVLARIQRKYSCFQPCIQVEREHEDPRSVRAIFLRGWKIEGDMLGVLSQCLPALAGLQAVHLWKVGLTERLLPALAAVLAHCPRLRTLSLEGNPLPEPAFHTLMGSDSMLAHLSLRNNSIGDAAARLIGQSLSTLSSSNRSLVSLVLSFNRISDLGAGYIAKGLRLNRSLLSLSLANNDIGDAGATRLAEVLGPFALTHGEVVERRRLLLVEALGRFRMTPKETEEQRERPSSLRGSMAPDKLPPAKHGKTPTKKKPLRREEARQSKKPPELRAAHSRDAKLSGQEKPSPEVPDPAKQLHPLLEARQHQGSIILPGNRALLNLNLTHNHITERGLGAFLAVLEGQQREKKPKMPGQQGLLCLSLEVSQVGDGARIAMGQGLMPRFPTEEPHPSHQPSLRAAPGAAAAAAGPPPQNPGPRGGAGIGHLAGPRGAAQAPTGEGELASCLFFKKNKKEIKTFTVKRRKINQMIQHRTATGQS